jgi:hypothetical protein
MGRQRGRVQINEEASKRLGEIFKTDPLKGLTDVLMPAMKAYGFDKPDDQIRELFKVLQRATTQRFLGEGIMNVNQMLAEAHRMEGAQGLEAAAATQNSNDLQVAIHNLGSSLDVLRTAIGGADGEITTMVGGINSISAAVRGIIEVVRAFGTAVPGTGALGRAFSETGPGAAITSLGSLGRHAAELQAGAQSVHSIFQDIESFIGNIKAWVPSWLKPSGVAPATSDGNGLFHKQSYVAPARSDKPTVLKAALNIDSRQLAEAVSYALADFHEVSPNAPSGNGAAYPALNGWNPIG